MNFPFSCNIYVWRDSYLWHNKIILYLPFSVLITYFFFMWNSSYKCHRIIWVCSFKFTGGDVQEDGPIGCFLNRDFSTVSVVRCDCITTIRSTNAGLCVFINECLLLFVFVSFSCPSVICLRETPTLC